MKDQNGPAALDRIADAVELYVLENLGYGDDLANAVAHLRTRIATRYRTAATSPVTPATGGTSGYSEVPPDRDPTWRDVPAERCDDDTLVRSGDRVWGRSGVWLVEGRGRIRRSTDVWIKRYDHPTRARAPQTVDVAGSELRTGDTVVGRHFVYGFDAWNAPVVLLEVRPWIDSTATYRVRLPRPAVEPNASRDHPQTADVSGIGLLVGDVVVGICDVGRYLPYSGPSVVTRRTPRGAVSDQTPTFVFAFDNSFTYRVLLPRPTADDVTPPEGDLEAAIEARGERDVEPSEAVAEDERCGCYRAGSGEHLRCARMHGHAGPCTMADVEPRSPGPRDQCARMLGPGQWCNRIPGHDGECKAPAHASEARPGPRPWVATPCHVELWDAIIDFADAPPVSVKRELAVVAVERAVAAIVSAAIEKAVQKP